MPLVDAEPSVAKEDSSRDLVEDVRLLPPTTPRGRARLFATRMLDLSHGVDQEDWKGIRLSTDDSDADEVSVVGDTKASAGEGPAAIIDSKQTATQRREPGKALGPFDE